MCVGTRICVATHELRPYLSNMVLLVVIVILTTARTYYIGSRY